MIDNYWTRFKNWGNRKHSFAAKLSFFFVLIHLLIIGVIYVLSRINPATDAMCILLFLDFPVIALYLITSDLGASMVSFVIFGSIFYGVLGAFVGFLIDERRNRALKGTKTIREITPGRIATLTLTYAILGLILNCAWWVFSMFSYGMSISPNCEFTRLVRLLTNILGPLSFFGQFAGGLITIIGSRGISRGRKWGNSVSVLGIWILMINPILATMPGFLVFDYSRSGPVLILLGTVATSIVPFILIILPGYLLIKSITQVNHTSSDLERD